MIEKINTAISKLQEADRNSTFDEILEEYETIEEAYEMLVMCVEAAAERTEKEDPGMHEHYLEVLEILK